MLVEILKVLGPLNANDLAFVSRKPTIDYTKMAMMVANSVDDGCPTRNKSGLALVPETPKSMMNFESLRKKFATIQNQGLVELLEGML